MPPFSTMLELGGGADRLATYQRCARHLAAGGVLALDNWFRGTGENADWGKPRPPKVMLFQGTVTHPRKPGIRVHYFEAQEYCEDDRMELSIFLDEIGPSGAVQRQTFPVVRHYASPDQTQAELKKAGFADIELYGGFGRERFLDPALKGRGRQVFIARRGGATC